MTEFKNWNLARLQEAGKSNSVASRIRSPIDPSLLLYTISKSLSDIDHNVIKSIIFTRTGLFTHKNDKLVKACLIGDGNVIAYISADHMRVIDEQTLAWDIIVPNKGCNLFRQLDVLLTIENVNETSFFGLNNWVIFFEGVSCPNFDWVNISSGII